MNSNAYLHLILVLKNLLAIATIGGNPLGTSQPHQFAKEIGEEK